MSASEKMRALGAADGHSLEDAFPALIEVVEVAEEYSRAALHWTEDSPRQKRMRVALSALDEALS